LKYLCVKRRYQQSAQGKATARKREEREDVRERRRQFSRSKQGRQNKAKYELTKKGQTTRSKALTKYRESPQGKAAAHRQHAQRKGAMLATYNPLTAQEWQEILKASKGKCYYCHKKTKLTVDHVIPLSKGGRHSKENVVPACQSCNSKKQDKMWLLC